MDTTDDIKSTGKDLNEVKPSDLTIFYSWQSDLPNKTNRTLIEESLEIAIKKISNNKDIIVVPRLDKDTMGISGSPNIATTILSKIDKSFLVVSDVSIVTTKESKRQSPNPNVLFELGYAIKSLGPENVVMVQNLFFGQPESLPFDLKLHRVATYTCSEKDTPSDSKVKLAELFEKSILIALENNSKKKEIEDEFKNLLINKSSIIVFDSKLKNKIDSTIALLKEARLYEYGTLFNSDEYLSRKIKVDEIMQDLIITFNTFGRWADSEYADSIVRQFERLSTPPEPEGGNENWINLAYYPSLLLLYSLGLGSIYSRNINLFSKTLDIKQYNRFTGNEDPIVENVNTFNVLRKFGEITKSQRYFPASDMLFDLFKPMISDLSDIKYEDLFDSLEYLLTLKFATYVAELGKDSFWVPTGSYAWRTRRRKIWESIEKEYDISKNNWIYMGLFENNKADLSKILSDTNIFVRSVANRSW